MESRTDSAAELERAGWRVVAAGLALLVLLRGAYVVAAADVFQYGEELEKGTAAKALLDGVAIPYAQKAYHLYEGGGFVVAHLKALAFAAVGETVLAHKLVALFTSGLVLWAGLALVGRHFGRRAAVVFTLLFVLGPESFQKLSLLSLGIHFEAGLFVLIVLDRAMRLAFERRAGGKEAFDAVLLGLAAGFGVYFNYQVALFVGAAGLLLLVRRRDLVLGRTGALGLAAFGVGLAPLVLAWATLGRAVFDIHGATVSASSENLARLGRFLRSMHEGGAVDAARAWVWPACALLLAPLGLRGSARGRLAFLAGVLVLWTAVYLSSGFVVDASPSYFGFMRLAPATLLGLVWLAACIGRGLASEGGAALRALATSALLVLVAAGSFAAAEILAGGRPGTPRANLAFLSSTKGYDYFGWAAKVLRRLPGEPEQRLAPLLGFDEPERALLCADLADAVAVTFPQRSLEDLEDLEALFARLDPEHAADFTSGLGHAIVSAGGWVDLGRALTAIDGFPPERAERYAEALGRVGGGWTVLPADVAREVEAVRGWPHAAAFWRGVGWRAFRRWVLWPYGGPSMLMKPDAARAWLARQAEDAAPHLLEGFERARALYRVP